MAADAQGLTPVQMLVKAGRSELNLGNSASEVIAYLDHEGAKLGLSRSVINGVLDTLELGRKPS